MFRKITFLLMVGLLISNLGIAQSKKEKQVAQAVIDLKEAMISADSTKLVAITSEDLQYGHSSGKIQDKASFIHSLVSGSSDFVSIDLTHQRIKVYDHTAVVRFVLSAVTNDDGKPGTVKLGIITVWHKQNTQWKLVDRQAVKVP